nr:hypothetical protein [Bradyrhizobium sp. BR 10261]
MPPKIVFPEALSVVSGNDYEYWPRQIRDERAHLSIDALDSRDLCALQDSELIAVNDHAL